MVVDGKWLLLGTECAATCAVFDETRAIVVTGGETFLECLMNFRVGPPLRNLKRGDRTVASGIVSAVS